MRRFASLRRPGDFARVRSRGRRIASADLTIFRSDAVRGDQRALVGISVSKAVGGAVVRNRVRRRLGAAAHEVIAEGARFRAVIVARPSALAAPFEQLRVQIERGLA